MKVSISFSQRITWPLSLLNILLMINILFTKDTQFVFLQWWNNITWKNKTKQKNSKLVLSIWRFSRYKKSSVWANYTKLTHSKIEKSFLMCKLCKTILVNPQPKKNGTTTLQRHPTRDECIKNRRGNNQATITSIMDVCLFINWIIYV